MTGHGTYLPEDNVSSRFRHLVCWMQQQLYVRPPWPIGDPAPRPGDPASRRLNLAELERIRTLADRLQKTTDRILGDQDLIRAGSFEQSAQQALAGAVVDQASAPEARD